MTLEEIRVKLRDLTGRFDLVDPDDGSDTGANFLIQSAVRLLDRLSDSPKSEGRYLVNVSSGEYSVSFQHCRAIQSVWIMNTEERWELEKVSLEAMQSYYSEITSEIDTGEPVYYTPALLRPIPETLTATETDAFVGNFMDLLIASNYDYNGIIFGPPAGGSYTLDIRGLFESRGLSDDDDQNFWSVMYPELLILATQYEIEVQKYRNSQGAQDYMNAILAKIRWIEADKYEQEGADLDQMGG